MSTNRARAKAAAASRARQATGRQAYEREQAYQASRREDRPAMTTTTRTRTDDQIRAIVRSANGHPRLNARNPHWLIGALREWAKVGTDDLTTDHERVVAIRELLDLHDAPQAEPAGGAFARAASAVKLSPAQADGRACTICGSEDAPMEPAVEPQWSPSGVMLFRCADTQACQAKLAG